MIRKICVEGRKEKETNGSMYCHNSYFFCDFTEEGVSDQEIAQEVSRLLSNEFGVHVDVICFLEIDDQENKFITPNDLVKLSETRPAPDLPVGAHRFIICDDQLFSEYMRTGENA